MPSERVERVDDPVPGYLQALVPHDEAAAKPGYRMKEYRPAP